jgi:hypothetical protein
VGNGFKVALMRHGSPFCKREALMRALARTDEWLVRALACADEWLVRAAGTPYQRPHDA